MLRAFIGNDRVNVRKALEKALKKGGNTVRLSDASTSTDLKAVAQGAGLFGETKQVVLENVSANKELYDDFLELLEIYATSEDSFFVCEEKPNAEVKRALQKYAESMEVFALPAKEKDTSVFAISSALKRGDKKTLWVSYRSEIMKGKAPEAILGVLFWGAKDMYMKSREGSSEYAKAGRYVAALTELPHEARRRGVELEYALERFVLSV